MAYSLSPQPLFVTVLIRNGNLRKYLNPHGWKRILGIKSLLEIATAMDFLHAKHILHADLKPENVLIDHGGVALVSDFGLAKMRTGSTVQVGANPGGSFNYMAPELHDGQDVNKASDVHAFSLIAYEVGGKGWTPFSEFKTAKQILTALEKGERTMRPYSIMEELWELIKCWWSQDASKRPSFAEIIKKLEVIQSSLASVDNNEGNGDWESDDESSSSSSSTLSQGDRNVM
jgi:serine/threonine protein kinase